MTRRNTRDRFDLSRAPAAQKQPGIIFVDDTRCSSSCPIPAIVYRQVGRKKCVFFGSRPKRVGWLPPDKCSLCDMMQCDSFACRVAKLPGLLLEARASQARCGPRPLGCLVASNGPDRASTGRSGVAGFGRPGEYKTDSKRPLPVRRSRPDRGAERQMVERDIMRTKKLGT